MEETLKVKLTKKALNDFIHWSTSRYNNYCGYGTKKENVDIVFASLNAGHYVGWRGKHEEDKKVFTITCASSVGENGNGRYWRTKQAGGDYVIDCENMTIETRGRKIEFIKKQKCDHKRTGSGAGIISCLDCKETLVDYY